MTRLSKEIVGKTNLDDATPEEKEKLMQRVVEAHRILYRSVVERHYQEVIKSLEK
jgi:hypothetical protein